MKRLLLAVCLAGAPTIACAQDFYAGKTITFMVGTDVGGGYDSYARLLTRHLGKYIPGHPAFIVQNMPGGSGRRAANHLYANAPQDGTWLGTLEQNIPFTQLLERENANFDTRRFNYLGNMSSGVGTIVTWHTSGVKTIEDARRKEIIIGATGTTGTNKLFPTLLNEVAGTRLKIVSGYKGGSDVDLAMERGEVAGRGSFSWSTIKATRADWLAEKKISILLQVGPRKAPDLPDVPLLLDLARDEGERLVLRLVSYGADLGRVVLTTPGVPAERVALLRRAFDAAMRDEELIAEARKATLDLNPGGGDEAREIIAQIAATPRAVVERTRKYLD